jgi:hypothetical protein
MISLKTLFLPLSLVIALVACDGTLITGNPSISFEPYSTAATAGRGPVLLRIKSTSSTILWEVIGDGTLEVNTSQLSAYYTPPSSVSTATTIRVKATLEGTTLSDQATITVNPTTAGTTYTVNATLGPNQQSVLVLAADDSGPATNAVVKVNETVLPLKSSLLGLYQLDVRPAIDEGQLFKLEITTPEGPIKAEILMPAIGQEDQACDAAVFTGPIATGSCITAQNTN